MRNRQSKKLHSPLPKLKHGNVIMPVALRERPKYHQHACIQSLSSTGTVKMLNAKAMEDGYAALTSFEMRYEEFLAAVASEGPFAYAKYYGFLKEIRRQAGKLGSTFKRMGRPSRFLEAALVAYDYADARVVQALAPADVDRQARICAAAMEVVHEAIRYESAEANVNMPAAVTAPGPMCSLAIPISF
jgi:hypothetical protein